MANYKTYDGKCSVVTLTAMRLSNCLLCGLPIPYPAKSTLNEFFRIGADRNPDPSARPSMAYISIGNRGHDVDSADGLADVVPISHRPINSGMFSEIPFVLRPKDSDLTDVQRKRYAGRKSVTIDGRDYWGYFYRVMDLRSAKCVDYEITRKAGVDTVKEFVYTETELRPVPSQLPNFDYDGSGNVSLPDGRYVESGIDIMIPWDEFDVQEYLNVTSIMRGTPRKAIVSEIALCSGVPGAAEGESATGSPFNYTEAFGVQVLYYISLYVNLAQTNDSMSLSVRIGQPTPFFVGAAS